jgi:hypothetical protein
MHAFVELYSRRCWRTLMVHLHAWDECVGAIRARTCVYVCACVCACHCVCVALTQRAARVNGKVRPFGEISSC